MPTTTSEFYSEGFLGYGEVGDFKYWSAAHIIPLVLFIAIIVLTYIFRDKIKNLKHENWIRYILAFSMMFNEMSFYWRLLYAGNPDGGNFLNHFPIQVCTISSILTVFLLTSENKHIFDYLGFVCLTLGLIPFFTPAVIVRTGPTYYRYYQFFFEHMIPVYSVFYFMFVKGYKMSIKNIWKPFVLLVPFGIIAIILNHNIEGANYFYLGHDTEGASLANIMPDNVYLKAFIYFLVAISLFAIEIGIYYLVIYLKNKFKKEEIKEDKEIIGNENYHDNIEEKL